MCVWPFFYAKGLLLHKGLYGLALNSWAPLAFLEGLMKAEGRLWRGTVGAASLQRPPRSFQEGSENPSLRTTYLAAFCAKRGRVFEAVKKEKSSKKTASACVCESVCMLKTSLFSRERILHYLGQTHTQLVPIHTYTIIQSVKLMTFNRGRLPRKLLNRYAK